MPSGKVHHAIWKSNSALAIAGVLTLFVAILSGDYLALCGVPLGYLLGLWISPDLDLVSITSDESRMMRHFGIIGALMVGYWTVYAYIMRFVGTKKRKGHRNFFSHFPGVSTFIRIVWIIWLPLLLLWYNDVKVPVYVWYTLLYVWVGLSYADLLHYAADFKILNWR